MIRDTNSGALINRDINSLNEYNMKRQSMIAQKEELNKVKSEIDGLKTDLLEIKQLMVQLLNKGSNV